MSNPPPGRRLFRAVFRVGQLFDGEIEEQKERRKWGHNFGIGSLKMRLPRLSICVLAVLDWWFANEGFLSKDVGNCIASFENLA
jgi:hypothetical protein